MRHNFLQFGLGMLFLLVLVLSLLFGITTPSLRRANHLQQESDEIRRLQEAQADLETAIDENDVALAQKALMARADPNRLSWNGSLLRTCMENGQLDCAGLLLRFGADVERKERNFSAVVLAYGPPLFVAVSCKQPLDVRKDLVQMLVRHGADPHIKVGEQGLMDECVWGHDAEMAEYLTKFGIPFGAREMAAFNRLDELRRLVEEDPQIVKKRFSCAGQESTLLALALRGGHRDMALFLMERGSPLDSVDGQGGTLLHIAARGGDPVLVSALAAHGLDVNARDKYQDTPLTDCAATAPPEVVSALLKAGADVNARGLNDKTALQRAVSRNRTKIIELLRAANADATSSDDNRGGRLDSK